MIEVLLDKVEVQLASQVGMMRNASCIFNGWDGNKNYGLEGDHWGPHIEGACGEMAVAKALGLYWNPTLDTFKSSGDLGGMEIRTRSGSHYDLLVREDDAENRPYILVTGRVPSFRVVGWMMGEDAKKPEWSQTYAGRPAAFFVPQSALLPISELDLGQFYPVRTS